MGSLALASPETFSGEETLVPLSYDKAMNAIEMFGVLSDAETIRTVQKKRGTE